MSNSFRRGRALALPTKAANEGALAPEVPLIPKHVHNFGTCLVTTQTWERRALFQCDGLARQLAETLLHYREEKRYLLHEYVVMPNHLHAIITPNDITLERAMQLIKGGFSFKIRQTRGKIEIWQAGFTDHRIRDAADYQTRREYIQLNPVRAGICQERTRYLWSSAASQTGLDPIPQRLKAVELAAQWDG